MRPKTLFLLAGSPLTMSILEGSDVMSISSPTEPALVDSTNYVTVNKSQTERVNLSQCQVKVIGTSLFLCQHLCRTLCICKYTKLVPYSITSVGHAADPGFLAVSPQVTLVINPMIGYRYFPPGSPRGYFPSQRVSK